MIPISRPALGQEEEQAVLEVMRSGQLAQGERVRRFEEAFAQATGGGFAVATSSGSSALFLALLAHGIGPGDEVITSPLTFIATANAIVHTGATPVFADVDDSLNLSLEAVSRLITPRTKCIMPVHLHGNPCDLVWLGEFAVRHGFIVVQDACQAIGATVAGQPLGTYGTAAYSFYATKNLTTGEGGMVTTNDSRVAELCASLRHQAYADKPYMHERVGFNFRMTEMQAAIGLVQLNRLAFITERRRRIASYYDEVIPPERFRRPRTGPDAGHVYHQYTVRVSSSAGGSRGGRDRDELRQSLSQAGIGTGVYYPVPIHRQPAYHMYEATRCPEAERASADMFSIPVHHSLSDAEVETIGTEMRRLCDA
jgi:perosamine synthetase